MIAPTELMRTCRRLLNSHLLISHVSDWHWRSLILPVAKREVPKLVPAPTVHTPCDSGNYNVKISAGHIDDPWVISRKGFDLTRQRNAVDKTSVAKLSEFRVTPSEDVASVEKDSTESPTASDAANTLVPDHHLWSHVRLETPRLR